MSISRIKTWLRAQQWYVRARRIQRIGMFRYARWQSLERTILGSPPVATQPVHVGASPCEVHILTWRGDWRLALWGAKSFYYFSHVDWPIVFHDGGGIGDAIRTQILRHFPNAQIIGWEQASAELEPELRTAGHHNIARARRENVMVRKLVDFIRLARSPNILSMDSDVLFVSDAHEIVELASGELQYPHFNRDSHDMYSLTSQRARERFGLNLPEKINAGLSLLPVRAVDMEFLNELFEADGIPTCRDIFPEQTACALISAKVGFGFLPPSYTVATGSHPADLDALGIVSRHYVGPVRHLLYEEGIPFLMKSTSILSGNRT